MFAAAASSQTGMKYTANFAAPGRAAQTVPERHRQAEDDQADTDDDRGVHARSPLSARGQDGDVHPPAAQARKSTRPPLRWYMEPAILILPSLSSLASTSLWRRIAATVRRTLVLATASTKSAFLLVRAPS